jgi:hypothetical protein
MTTDDELTPVEISKSLKKKLAKKPQAMQGAIIRCIRQLRTDWRHPSLRAKKLSGSDNFEVRVTAGDRLTFVWDGPKIVVTNHCNHDILKTL